MPIKPIVGRKGRPAYRVKLNLGMSNGKRHTICRTVYGTMREAQAMEDHMRYAYRKAQETRTVAAIYKMEREARAGEVRKIKLERAFLRASEKPRKRETGAARLKFKETIWEDFRAWMAERNPLLKSVQDITPKIAEDYIGFIRRNGSWQKFAAKRPAKLSGATQNEYLAALRQVFDALKNDSGMSENPFGGIEPVAATHVERYAYSKEQLNTIFCRADAFLFPMFFIGLFTGLSEGDICTLRKDDIVFDRHYIYRKRNKTAKTSRTISAIPMIECLEKFLRELLAKSGESEYVLPEQAALYLRNRSAVSVRVKTFLEKECGFSTCVSAGNDRRKQSVLDFHSLRHTFCSIAGAAGIPQNTVQSIVGHMTPAMTELYSRHVAEEDGLRGIRLLENRIAEMQVLNVLPAPKTPASAPESDERAELRKLTEGMSADDVKAMLEMLRERKAEVAE